MSYTFLQGVNRILQLNGFIRGDTDTLSSFSDTSHNSSSSIAQIAVQQEITDLCSRQVLPYQHKESGSITLVTGTRTYALASDYVQLWGDPGLFYDSTANIYIPEFPGGENALKLQINTYRTDQGSPQWYYFELGTTQQVSFYLVPDSGVNGRAITYDYGASVNVSASSDPLPFPTVDQYYAFVDMAARRFKFLYEGKTDFPVDQDGVYRIARANLYALIKGRQPYTSYGRRYLPPEIIYSGF